MPEFANPEFLLLAPLAVLFGWWSLRRRRSALRFSGLGTFAGLSAGRARRAKWGGASLRTLAVVALIVASAGPRRPDERTRIPAEGIAIVLALDVSGSMATADAPWEPGQPPIARLEAARRAFKLFVAGGDAPDGIHFEPRPSDQIGLVTFAALPHTACPLTLNHTVLIRVSDAQETKIGLDAGTNIGDGIAEGLIRLEAAGDRKKVLIVLSDGEHNVSETDVLKPETSAKIAAALGVTIYTIDAGGDPPPGAPADAAKQRRDGQATLRAVAEITGGRSFNAPDGASLLAAYKEIDELERTKSLSFQYRRYFEHAPWWAAAAFALLALVHVLERTRWRVLG